MASSIDFGTLCAGALIGVGCRKQIKAAGRVAANLASALTTSAAIAVNSAAAELNGQQSVSQQSVGQQNGGKIV